MLVSARANSGMRKRFRYAAIDRRFEAYTPGPHAAPGASVEAAVAAASRDVLVALLPEQAALVEAAYVPGLCDRSERRSRAYACENCNKGVRPRGQTPGSDPHQNVTTNAIAEHGRILQSPTIDRSRAWLKCSDRSPPSVSRYSAVSSTTVCPKRRYHSRRAEIEVSAKTDRSLIPE
jgi:hypothetical protein